MKKNIIEEFKNWLCNNYFTFYNRLDNFIMCSAFRSLDIECYAVNLVKEFTSSKAERKELYKYLNLQ